MLLWISLLLCKNVFITVRKHYVDILNSKDVKKAISPQDLDISRKCEQLIMSEPTFDDLNGSIGQ